MFSISTSIALRTKGLNKYGKVLVDSECRVNNIKPLSTRETRGTSVGRASRNQRKGQTRVFRASTKNDSSEMRSCHDCRL